MAHLSLVVESLLLSAQVTGIGYDEKGTVNLLPNNEELRDFSNISVGKLVEVRPNLCNT